MSAYGYKQTSRGLKRFRLRRSKGCGSVFPASGDRVSVSPLQQGTQEKRVAGRAEWKAEYQLAAKGIQFPWRWTSGAISTNLDVIWGMSDKSYAKLFVGP